MYKPKLEDIQVEKKWGQTDISELLSCAVVLYLLGGNSDATADDGKRYHFGDYRIACIHIDATDEEKHNVIVATAKQLIYDFDVKNSATKQHYEGHLEYLRPLDLVGFEKLIKEDK